MEREREKDRKGGCRWVQEREGKKWEILFIHFEIEMMKFDGWMDG